MSDRTEQTPPILTQYRALLTKLPGVYAAAVLPGEDESVREIHIVASKARNPKQLSRDVQSALAAAFDLQVDHRVISIAQIGDDPFSDRSRLPSDGMKGLRLQCLGVRSAIEKDGYSASVHLKAGDRDLTGECACRNTPAQRARAIVQATLDAVHLYLQREDLFSIVTAQTTIVGGVTIAITVLEYAGALGETLLVGAARQEDDVAVGFVRSTLDALNRCFAKLAADG